MKLDVPKVQFDPVNGQKSRLISLASGSIFRSGCACRVVLVSVGWLRLLLCVSCCNALFEFVVELELCVVVPRSL